MKEYLVVIEVTKTYEIMLAANDDEQIFRWNGEPEKMPSEIKNQIKEVEMSGDLVSTEIKVIEVIEGK